MIYLITSPSGKQYVGQTTSPIRQRIQEHASNSPKYNHLPIKRAFKKYGTAAMKVEVLVQVPRSFLNFYEKHFISAYDTFHKGYNRTEGGEQCPLHVPEVLARMKATVATPAHRELLSKIQKRNHSAPGSKEKRSASLKAAHAKPEVKARFKAGWKKAQSRPEQRLKNSRAQLVAQKRPEVNAKRSASLKTTNLLDPTINERRGKSGKEANKRDPTINERRSATLKATLARKRAERAAAAHLSSGTTTSLTAGTATM